MGEKIADSRGDANYEIVDIADYKLPLLGEADATEQATAWNTKLASLDGFVFIVQEYNHSISASLKMHWITLVKPGTIKLQELSAMAR